jgi:hypothetical protein
MTYNLDPHCDWERSWTFHHPEPFPDEPWTIENVLLRVFWHQNRWEAYKREFPQYILNPERWEKPLES